MNYLAHFHLSYGDREWLLGALLGDFVKGPLVGHLEAGVEHGIVLHRRIDAFTDTHPEVRAACRRFDPRFRRFGGILLDIVFDHFLSRHWRRFHRLPLQAFSDEIYGVLADSPQLQNSARTQAERLIRYNVLAGFGQWGTVEAALARVGDKLRRDNPLAEAPAELTRHYDDLEQLFLVFYPQLEAFADATKRELEGLSAAR